MKRRAGFSLVEMMISLTIFSLIAASVYSLLHLGLRARGGDRGEREEDRQIRLIYQLISTDASNMIDEAPEWKFEGSQERISFITVLNSWNGRGEQSERRLARVTYVYNGRDKMLSRRVADVSDGLDDRWAKDVFRAHVRRAQFSYPFRSGERPYRWRPEWKDPDEIPIGIRVRVDDYETAISIPLGVMGRE